MNTSNPATLDDAAHALPMCDALWAWYKWGEMDNIPLCEVLPYL